MYKLHVSIKLMLIRSEPYASEPICACFADDEIVASVKTDLRDHRANTELSTLFKLQLLRAIGSVIVRRGRLYPTQEVEQLECSKPQRLVDLVPKPDLTSGLYVRCC